jgi:drug/metabolite transporter (DMT)-like permease
VALATMGMVLLAQPSAHAPLRGDAFTLAASIAIAAEITLAGMFAPRADPRRLAVLQCAVVGCTALALTLLTGARLPPPGLWLACAGGLGLLSAYLQITANWAMRTIPASRAVLIFALEPVFAALFGEAAGERMNAEAMAGAALILTALAANAMAARGRRIEGTPDRRKRRRALCIIHGRQNRECVPCCRLVVILDISTHCSGQRCDELSTKCWNSC